VALRAIGLRLAVPLALTVGLLIGSGLGEGAVTAGKRITGSLSSAPLILTPLALALPSRPSAPLAGHPFTGTPAVGALVRADEPTVLRTHSCTASVVHSPHRNLVVTAAHCVPKDVRDLGFVPGYLGGKAPYGVWQVDKALVDPRWSSGGDPDYDVAFLVVHGTVEDMTGANNLGIGISPGILAAAIGYPSAHDEPIVCVNYTRKLTDRQLRFDCADYTDGTSGGPLLTKVDPATGRGTVLGVVGGYQQGGETPDVSYSPYFGAEVGALYRTAISSA
jgi:hypothetical protein